MKDANVVVGEAIKACPIEIEGRPYIAIRLAGPEAITAMWQKDWDYVKCPIGPGTLGWGKTLAEVEELRDNFYLCNYDDIKKVGEWHSDPANKGATCPIKIGAFRLQPSGIYGGCASEGNLFEVTPEMKRNDLDVDSIRNRLKEKLG